MIEITDDDINQIEAELDLTFDQSRRDALKGYDDVQACPGSGKTTMVAAKLLIIAKKWTHSYKGVCVLTHTNVAKNEIISSLQKNPAGYKLLAYPHFIGTIQEFVNKYLSVPLLRSDGIAVNQIDDEACCSTADKFLKNGTRIYLQNRHVESLKSLQYKIENDELKLNVPGFANPSKSDSYRNLEAIKSELVDRGLHYYQEMYVYSEVALDNNPDLIESICLRFPVTFIDEMQDTQKFQDELLNRIFDVERINFQRFGDPDQAIYGESQDGNDTYNNQKLERVVTSHRFTNDIAFLAKNLSLNRIDLSSVHAETEGSRHTIFLVDQETRQSVFESFAAICSDIVPEQCDLPIKAIGAVGKFKENSLTICDYFPNYEGNQTENRFRPSKLIHYLYRAKELAKKENAKSYNLLIEAFVRCGQLSNGAITYLNGKQDKFSKRSLKKLLLERQIKTEFNSILLSLLVNQVSEQLWSQEVSRILDLVGIGTQDHSISDFIEFEAPVEHEEIPVLNNELVFDVNDRNIKIDITTIHSVKGETHAATLVLENKFHNFDAELILEYILGTNVRRPTAARKIKFMKQFYVGFTRPKHLLCLAMDKSRFPEEHIGGCQVAGWNIVDLTV